MAPLVRVGATSAVLSQWLEHFASTDPASVAVVDHGRPVRFVELARGVRRLAAWLLARGFVPGDVVGITVRAPLRHLLTTHALMRIGCVELSLPSYEPAGARATLAARCRASCVITDGADDDLPGLSRVAPDFDAVLADASLDAAPLPPVSRHARASILTSSGTTGRPKLVACSQYQLWGYGQPETPGATVSLVGYPIESNAGKWIGLRNLARGWTLVYEDLERVSLQDVVARDRVTRVNLAPARVEALARACERSGPTPAFPGVRIHTGGAPVSAEVRRLVLQAVSPVFCLHYGATEIGLVTQAGPDVHASHPDSVGHLFPGIDLRIVDDDGRELPPGERGLVQVRSDFSATAYLDDDEASAKMFRDGWFQPGDVGAIGPGGMLFLSGRSDDMMIMNSINVFPAEIEKVATGYPGVHECAAFGFASSAFGQIPALAVVAAPGLDDAALLAWCRERLGLRAPRKIVRVDALPRNALGKVLRREIAASLREPRE